VELLVVIAILGIMAAIILFNISGVNANAACKGMKTDGLNIQNAADLYWKSYRVYPVGAATPAILPGAGDVATPSAGTRVDQGELVTASLLPRATANWNTDASPAGTEVFTYKAGLPAGTVHGTIKGDASCTYN